MVILQTPRLVIRTVAKDDCARLADFESKNKRFWSSTASTTGDDPSTTGYWDRKLPDFQKEFEEGRSVRFMMLRADHLDACIGVCNFTQLFRGPFQACYLGYKIDADYEGKGLMQEALKETIRYMFQEQNLHRIMANYLPNNLRSQNLLQHLGFQKEGYAKEYLLIDGIWEDHILASLTNRQWKLLA